MLPFHFWIFTGLSGIKEAAEHDAAPRRLIRTHSRCGSADRQVRARQGQQLIDDRLPVSGLDVHRVDGYVATEFHEFRVDLAGREMARDPCEGTLLPGNDAPRNTALRRGTRAATRQSSTVGPESVEITTADSPSSTRCAMVGTG